jgi:FtsP/CotA-like multicopper oxidase with cupredoxin domain
MKAAIKVVLYAVSLVLAYLIYLSVMAPINFNKIREERFSAVIEKLKDIRDAQVAYKTVNGKFASDFETLIAFVDTGVYTITQQKDSSFMRYNRAYRIDMQVDTVVVDTLGTIAVKDSLFKSDNSYKNLFAVPYAQNGERFEMKADIVNKQGFDAPVFMASVKKDVVLYDQPKDLLSRENAHNSIEEVNGTTIKVGSLTDVSTSGNWPSIYDKKKKKNN